jgi:type I restriction enzyme S subunit
VYATTEVIPLRPRHANHDRRLLFYYLLHPDVRAVVAEKMEGTTGRQRVPENVLLDLPFPEIDSDEQKTIADALHLVRLAIRAQDRSLENAVELKRAVMHGLFTHGLHAKPLKETPIGVVPANWEIGRVGKFALFQRGFDITKSEQFEGKIPVVSSGGIRSYHNEARAKGPGVVIGRKGSIGSLHYVEPDYWPHDTTLWCTDFLGNIPKFVFYRLHTLNLKKLDSGATNPALNRNFLHDEIITWPELDEQRDIVEILDGIDRKIELHEDKRGVLERLFKALLHKLITGQIRMADLDRSALSQTPFEGAAA